MPRNNSSPVQFYRGTTTQHNSYTGAVGELTYDITKKTLVVHDGSTIGGFPVVSAATISSALAEANAYADSITPDASTSVPGRVQLSNSLTSTSTSTAATSKAISDALAEAKAYADSLSSSGSGGNITSVVAPIQLSGQNLSVLSATTSRTGVVQLTDSTSSTSTTTAATANSVRLAYNLANGKWTSVAASTSTAGIVQLTNSTSSTSTTTAATANSVKLVRDILDSPGAATLSAGSNVSLSGSTFSLPTASTSAFGVTTLTNSLANNTTTAVTVNNVKTVQDTIDKLLPTTSKPKSGASSTTVGTWRKLIYSTTAHGATNIKVSVPAGGTWAVFFNNTSNVVGSLGGGVLSNVFKAFSVYSGGTTLVSVAKSTSYAVAFGFCWRIA